MILIGTLIGIFNAVRSVAKFTKNFLKAAKNVTQNVLAASQLLRNPALAIKMVIKKFLIIAWNQLKGYLIILGIIILIFAVVICSVMGFFSKVKDFINKINPFAADKPDKSLEEARKFLEQELTDEEKEELKDLGIALEIEEIGVIIENETKSYPQNNESSKRSWSHTHDKKVNDFLGLGSNDTAVAPTYTTNSSTAYSDHSLNLGEIAEPYRLFYQMQFGISNMLYDFDTYDDYKKIVNKKVSNGGLESEFDWGFKHTESIIDGCLFYDIDPDSFEYDETVWNSTYTKVNIYKDSSLDSTDETQEDSRFTYPLPYLNSVKTMFKDYEFEYERIVLEEGEWIAEEPDIDEWTTEEYSHTNYSYDEETGEIVDSEDVYETVYWKSETFVETRRRVEKDFMLPPAETDNGVLVNFLIEQGSDTEVDILFLEELLRYMPETEEIMQLLGETEGFIEGYEIDIDALDLEISPTELLGDVPLFLQTDPRWKNLPYGREGTIGGSGCGPTSMAMVITSFDSLSNPLNISKIDLDGDGVVNPYEMGKWAADKGYRAYGKGSYWTLFAGAGKEAGLNVVQVGRNQAQSVLDALRNGDLVVASMSKGEFTKGGHFIVLAGIDSSGKIIVRDPNSASRSNKTYNFSNPILSQANQFWIVRNPNN